MFRDRCDRGRDRVMGYPVYRARIPVERRLRTVVDRVRPDVIVVQNAWPITLIKAALECDRPTIVYIRDVEFQKLAEPLPRHSKIRYIANSHFTADRSRQRFGVDCTVLPPLVRPHRYRCQTTRQTVTFINPVPVKGAEIAFALAARRPDIPFRFVEGWRIGRSGNAARRRRAAALPNVAWQRAAQDMRSIYSATRILLVPSIWEESWGRVVTEAQFSGIPVLASQRGGLPESVGPGGVLVDPDGPMDDWLAALSMLWDQSDVYDRYVEATCRFAERPEMDPGRLIGAFVGIALNHYRSRAS